MDNHLVKWNTGRLISLELSKLEFFIGYKGINLELYEVYSFLKDYANTNYNDVSTHQGRMFGYNEDVFKEWTVYLDKVLDFQLFVTSEEGNGEKGKIAERAKEVFGNKDVAEAYCADLHVLNQLNMLLEYSESVRDLFNYIVPLIGDRYGGTISMTNETEQEIREVLEVKGLGDFQVPEHLIITQQVKNPELS